MRCERRKRRHIKTLAQMFSLFVRTSTWKKSEGGKSRSKVRGRSDNWRKLDKNECAYCRQKCHWKKDCPILKEKGSKSNVVRDDDTDTNNALTISLSVIQTSEWILDSGCSYHMCSNREMSLDFKEFNGGVVYMGNDSTCKMMGIDSVQIKVFDGVVQKINDVRYVPDLKENLISLAVLDASGYRIILEGGNLKVARGALVAIKETRRGSIYYLNETIIIGHAVVASSKEQDISNLWHMRLGHAGEKALQTLVNQGVLKSATTGKIDFCEQCIFGKQKM